MKKGSHCVECDRKPVKNRTSGGKTAQRIEFLPICRFKPDRLLAIAMLEATQR